MKRNAFTLVELLVVVAIIAILTLIGIVVFTGVQKNTRDARRNGDIDSIAKALEVNKTTTGYSALADGQFSGGVVPKEPTGRTQKYCFRGATTGTITNPGPWTTACPTDWTEVLAGVPSALPTVWKVCTLLDDQTTVSCRSSAQ